MKELVRPARSEHGRSANASSAETNSNRNSVVCDDVKQIIKRHLIFVTGRPGGKRANLERRVLSRLNLDVLNLRSVFAPAADFTCCSLIGTDFSEADLFTANFSEANCTKTNFHFADLRGAKFSAAKLVGANFERADLRAGQYTASAKDGHGVANLSNADLDSAVLKKAKLDQANMIRIRARGANFSGASMHEVNLSDADLSAANLANAKLKGAVLAGADLSGANLKGADLRGADLRGAVLNDVDMSQSQTDTRSMKIDEPKQSVTPDVEEMLRLHAEFLNTDGASGQCADLSGADLGDTDLSGLDLSAANLSGANLAGARLIRCKMNMTIATGADLSGADLAAADLRGINLARAKLVEANLRRANLTGLDLKDKNGQKTGKIWRPDLSSADFSGANLVDARLKSAKLDGAKFTGAHLAGTDFTGCVLAKADLTGAELDGAIIEADENTECHRILCEIAMIQRDYDRATLHNDKALALNPNDPRIVAQKGELLTWTGDPEAAVEVIEQALALDPFGQEERIHLLGFALYTLGRYQEAADAFKRITDPKVTHLAFLAASRAELGDDGAASAHSAKILRMNPEFAIASHVESIPYQDPSHRERYRAGLRKAGLPE